jgi:adenylate cyclase
VRGNIITRDYPLNVVLMPDPPVRRRLAAILATDVVGYSRLMEQDETGTLTSLKARRKEAFDPLVSRHQGRIFKVTGDGALVEFGSAVNAVECAVELQQAMAAANVGCPTERQIVLRMGINLGDVMVEQGDLYGDGINIAARLEGIADPGAILLSSAAFEHVKGKVPLQFEDLGLQRLKNIAEPVRAYRVVGTPHVSAPPLKCTTHQPAIAVLPFVNMGSEEGQDYFADGLTEDIITELSRFRSLCVISRASSFAYKDRAINFQDVGSDLGVQYILEGSVRRIGAQIRITAQLIEAASGKHLWAERFDRNIGDVFAVQDEIMRKIVGTLPVHVEGAECLRSLQRPTDSFSAYEHWLRGKHLLNRARSKQDVLRAREHFEKALELDPSFAAAVVELGQSYYAEYHSSWTTSRQAAADKVFELGQIAVELDPFDSRTHLELAWGYLNAKGDFDLAKTQVEEALSLNPNDYYNYCFGGWLSACSGDLDHAVACSNEALRRSPIVSDGCLETLLIAEYLAENYEGSIKAFGRMLRPPGAIYGWIAAAYAQMGRTEQARAMAELFLRNVGDLPWVPKTNDPADWRQFWAADFPTKKLSALDHLFDGLRKAGLVS